MLYDVRIVCSSGELRARSWAILKDEIEDITEVPEPEIREAVRLLFFLANLKAEPGLSHSLLY